MSSGFHLKAGSSRVLRRHVTLADTGSVSAAVRQVAGSLDLKLAPDSPWKKTTPFTLKDIGTSNPSRPVVPDSVALQMGVRTEQSEMDEGQIAWMDCESKGKFEGGIPCGNGFGDGGEIE